MKYNENQLIDLARNNPKELARILVSPDVDTKLLATGVEILAGENPDEDIILPVFRKLLKHMNAIVREGALLGIAAFCSTKKPPRDILDRLNVIASNDPLLANKKTAKSLIEDLGI